MLSSCGLTAVRPCLGLLTRGLGSETVQSVSERLGKRARCESSRSVAARRKAGLAGSLVDGALSSVLGITFNWSGTGDGGVKESSWNASYIGIGTAGGAGPSIKR